MRFAFINNFSDQIAAPVSDTATNIELAGKASDIQAALQSADAVALTLFTNDSQGNETQREVVYATASAPPLVTVTRAQEGTTAVAFAPGDGVEARLTAGVLDESVSGALKQYIPPGGSPPHSAALGQPHSDGGYTYPPAQANAPRAYAVGNGAVANGDSAVAVGGTYFDDTGTEYPGSIANSGGSVAIGVNSASYAIGSVALGSYSRAYGVNSVAAGDAKANGEASIAIGYGATAQADFSCAIFGGYSNGYQALALGGSATGENAVSIGQSSSASALNSIALMGSATAEGAVSVGAADAGGINSVSIGQTSGIYVEDGIVIGTNAAASSPGSMAIGANSDAAPPQVTAVGSAAKGYAPETSAYGYGAECQAPYSVALGRSATATVPGGLAVSAISYVPGTYNQTGENAGPPPTASRQAAMQSVIATVPLDLTDGSGSAAFGLPTGTMLFPDAFDVVITDASGAGGSPEIQIGPDASNPADYLASTPVSKTVTGGRETYAPLITDGITGVHFSVAAAGTGTTYQAKLVVRGYVMEI